MRAILNNYIVKRIGALFLLYLFFRVYFYLYNLNLYQDSSSYELAKAFLMGFRFDFSAIFMINSLFVVFWLLFDSLRFVKIFKLVDLLFIFVNSLFFSFNLADAELIRFNGKKIDFNYFKIINDIHDQSVQLIFSHWRSVTLFFVLMYILTRVVKSDTVRLNLTYSRRIIFLFLFLIMSVLAIRGGLQNKPLKEAHAFVFHKSDLGLLALNSSFTFIKSYNKNLQNKLKFMSENEVRYFLASTKRGPSSSMFNNQGVDSAQLFSQMARPNIVILMLESFACEYIGAYNQGEGYTPYFDSLSEHGYLFKKFYANGRRSIEAIPSVLAGIPSLLNDAFLTSNYQGAYVQGLGDILKPLGYETAFFHGAKNGTMFFDSFIARIGIDHYFGLTEYPNKEDYDGYWGIFDEPYFKYSAKMISGLQQPFAATIYTLSSHQPFTLPKQFRGQFIKGEHPIHESIGYADYSLNQFFEFAKYQKWFDNTVFFITADHTSVNLKKEYRDDRGQFRVPLLIYSPKIKLPKFDLELPAQHIDILPTVVDIVAKPDQVIDRNPIIDRNQFLGHSLLQNHESRFVVNKLTDGFWYEAPGVYIKVNNSFENVQAIAKTDEERRWHEARLKAYLQYFTNGILTNSLFSSKDHIY